MQITLRDAAYDDTVTAALIADLQQEYVTRYGGPDATPLDGAQFGPPHGAFLVAYAGDEVIGCIGLRRQDGDVAEIKRMFVRAGHRRQGHGRRLLAALEDRARAMGYRRIVLETGTPQPEARTLYTAMGYTPIPGYGFYRDSTSVRCYAKDL